MCPQEGKSEKDEDNFFRRKEEGVGRKETKNGETKGKGMCTVFVQNIFI